MTITPQDLYINIPPTVIRNRKEVFRTPKNVPFWHAIGDFVFGKMLRSRFFSVMIKGKENAKLRDERFATIYYTPHCNWWDGILMYNILRHVIHVKKFRVMIEEMNRFPLFQYVGSYPVNKKSAQTAMQSLKYTTEHVLGDKDVGLLLFPQGIVRPPHFRPETFQTGLAYMVQESVKKYGGINLQPVATYYCFLREDRPEILVEFDKPKVITTFENTRHSFTEIVQKDFERFCDNQLANVARADFEGYEYVFRERLHWWKKIEKKLRNVGIKNNKFKVK
jgi:1-acyl-sn-glycerol-3-phosphate acyltransferase